MTVLVPLVLKVIIIQIIMNITFMMKVLATKIRMMMMKTTLTKKKKLEQKKLLFFLLLLLLHFYIFK
ncbi:hypothetical protein BDC45DRAFT_113146 [Circinella umbellata]|nr:hypothetical protein BDC45DRAFT_319147 [Circinella umbellata]KAI7854820.1 hypothetical protein BDC45DRAFT_113146 [Circinella umbellata]